MGILRCGAQRQLCLPMASKARSAWCSRKTPTPPTPTPRPYPQHATQRRPQSAVSYSLCAAQHMNTACLLRTPQSIANSLFGILRATSPNLAPIFCLSPDLDQRPDRSDSLLRLPKPLLNGRSTRTRKIASRCLPLSGDWQYIVQGLPNFALRYLLLPRAQLYIACQQSDPLSTLCTAPAPGALTQDVELRPRSLKRIRIVNRQVASGKDQM